MAVIGLILAVLLFIAGLAGTVMPVLPGAILIWLGTLVYGLFTGFDTLHLGFYIGQGVAVGLTMLVDYAANIWGVRRFGGSRAAVLGSMAGVILGGLLFGPLGILFGPFAGAVTGELAAGKNLYMAAKTAAGTLVGIAGGTICKLFVEALMIIWFFSAVY